MLQEVTANAMRLSVDYSFYGACAGTLLALAVRRPRHSLTYIGLGMGVGSGYTFQKSNEFILFKQRGGKLKETRNESDDELINKIELL